MASINLIANATATAAGSVRINVQYDKTITDNDVADACGIGHWAINNWEKAFL